MSNKNTNNNIPLVYAQFYDESVWTPLRTYKSLQTLTFPPYRPKLKLSCTHKPKVYSNDFNYTITIILPNSIKPNSKIVYWAARPRVNKPFKSSIDAYDNTSAKGIVKANNRTAIIKILYPNSYWESDNKFQPPHIHFKVCNGGFIWTSILHEKQVDNSTIRYSPIFILFFIVIVFIIIVLFAHNHRKRLV